MRRDLGRWTSGPTAQKTTARTGSVLWHDASFRPVHGLPRVSSQVNGVGVPRGSLESNSPAGAVEHPSSNVSSVQNRNRPLSTPTPCSCRHGLGCSQEAHRTHSGKAGVAASAPRDSVPKVFAVETLAEVTGRLVIDFFSVQGRSGINFRSGATLWKDNRFFSSWNIVICRCNEKPNLSNFFRLLC